MIEANKFRLGLFVICGFLLGVVILFILGLSQAFEPKINFMTVFDESVQGLDDGAPVKYRGVTIGKVTRVAIRPVPGERDNLIMVEMVALPSAVDPSALMDRKSESSKSEFFYEFFTKEVQRGLRCRIDMAGITGVKYIEIDYFKDDTNNKVKFTPPPGVYYLPSTPSLFREIAKNITQALIKISSVDFKRISEEMETTLVSVNKYLNDPKISKLIDRLDSISSNLEATSQTINESLDKKTIDKIVGNLEKSLIGIEQLSNEFTLHLKKAKIGETTAEFRNSLAAAKHLKKEVSDTLKSLNELIRSIDNDPSSIIRGKHQPEYEF